VLPALFNCQNHSSEELPEQPVLELYGTTDSVVILRTEITNNTVSYALYSRKNAEEWKSGKYNIVKDTNNPDKSRLNIQGLEANTVYSFYATSVNVSGKESEPSNTITLRTMLKQPKITKIEALNPFNISLEWDTVPGADYYNIYQGESESSASLSSDYALRGGLKECKYTVNTLTAENHTYYFCIRAFADSGGVKNSSIRSEAKSAKTKLNTPVLFAGEEDKHTANSIALKWKPVQNADNYQINYAVKGVNGQPAGNWTSKNNIKDTVTSTGFLEYTIGGLQSNTDYLFRIKALTADNESLFSEPFVITTRIETPNISITNRTTQIRLSWPPVAGADYYILYFNESDSRPTSKYIGIINTTQYVKENLNPDTDYYFWITAYGSQNYSLPGTAVKGHTVTSVITIDFKNPADPVISEMPEYLYRVEKKVYQVVVNTSGWDTYKWYLNGELKSTAALYTISSQLPIGPYELTVVVTKNGIPYSAKVCFKVN
jgi:fibronectin type 3 domain-containing protein